MPAARSTLAAGTLVALLTGIGAVQLLPGVAPAARAAGLVKYDDCADLLGHYRSELRRSLSSYGYGAPIPVDMAGAGVATSAEGSRSAADASAVGSGPSGTNVQERGVDEPDFAKLHDGRLVVVTGNRVRVLSASDRPQVLGSLRVGGPDTYGGELLPVGDRVVALLPGYRPDERDRGGDAPDDSTESRAYLPGTPTTRVLLLDVSGDSPRLVEESTYEAQYVSARVVDGSVRLVTTTRPQPPVFYGGPGVSEREARKMTREATGRVTLRQVLPHVLRRDADGTVLERGPAVDCREVFHARTPVGVSTLMVTTLRPDNGLEATDSTAVTTDGDLVYASADRLYVATSRWGTVGPVMPLVRGDSRVASPQGEVTTELHGFDTSSATETRYVGTGSVPGYVLGRWALSFHEGALRVATTRQPPWDSGRAEQTSSMVVKLTERGGRLVQTGRVGGLGRTEQIKAVRYFGDLAAVVTFRQTDPLYLLDLSGKPRLLGELKVPGFSTYLHPLGDGLLLGVGQDADKEGRVTGMQASVFDISDPSDPRQVDRLRLGEGHSPALEDSRAFSYDPDERLAAFAFTAYDWTTGTGENASALAIRISEDGTLREAGRMPISDDSWNARVLLDDDRLFAVGETGVTAGDTATMTPTGSVDFR